MRQSLLILILSFSFTASADPKADIGKIYSGLTEVRTGFYENKNMNRSNAFNLVTAYKSYLNSALRQIEALEDKTESLDPSPEGNRYELELQLLAPIEKVIQSKFSKSACALAPQHNRLNAGKMPEHDDVHAVLEKLCPGITPVDLDTDPESDEK